MPFRPLPATLARRVAGALIALVLIANAFDGCLVDPGTPAAAMACCQHQGHGDANAVAASDCCKTRNAQTRMADGSTIGASPMPPQSPGMTVLKLVVGLDQSVAAFPQQPSSNAESPPGSPPFLPLRI